MSSDKKMQALTKPQATKLPPKRALVKALGLVLATSSLPVMAAENDAVVLPTMNVEASSVEQKRESEYKVEKASSTLYTQPLVDTPKTIDVITEKAFKDQGVSDLRDALRNVSGITMQAGEGGAPAGDNLTIRGFSATNDFFIDGVRDIGSYTRDTFNIEQIEVTKGPNSSISGRGSAGGSINSVTKTAQLENFNSSTLRYGQGGQARVSTDINSKITDNAAVRLNLLFDDGSTPGRDEIENKSRGVAGAVTVKPLEATTASVSFSYLDQDNVPEGGVPLLIREDGDFYLKDSTAENFYGVQHRDYDKNKATTLKAVVEHEINDAVTVRNQMYYGDTETRAAFTRPYLCNEDLFTRGFCGEVGKAQRGNAKLRDEDREIFSNQTAAITQFKTGSIKHDLVVGVDITREDYKRKRLVEELNGSAGVVDVYNPVTNDPYNGVITDTGGKQDGNYDSEAVYFQETMAFNPKWELNFGARYEEYDQEFSQNYATTRGGVVTGPFRRSKDDDLKSWNVAGVYKPLANASVYLGVANSETPLGTNLNLDDEAQNLDSEENRTVELGAKYELNEGKAIVSAAIFHSKKRNAQTETDSGDTVLAGKQTVKGGELGFSGELTNKVDLIANYTYLDTDVSGGDDVELFNTPEHSGNMWTSYQWNKKLNVAGGFQFIGKYNNGDNTKLPSETLLNAAATYQVNKNVGLQLNINNLTDEKYLLKARGRRGIPGEGRNASVALNVDF